MRTEGPKAFRSPAPHTRSSGRPKRSTKGGKPNKYTPHSGAKQGQKAASRRWAHGDVPLEDLVAEWHAMTEPEGALWEFLGMTWDEYKAWIKDPE